MVPLSVIQLALALASASLSHAASGSGKTTRYWDCCKPSCAWQKKASVSQPVLTCDRNDNPLTDPDIKSGCDGGTAFSCGNQSPWKVTDNLAYGFAATAISGGTESSWCCACYALKFTSGPVAGKTMVVQSTNTGGDLGSNHFDIQMPGGGIGLFDGCTPQFGGLPGNQYGGITSRSQCDSFPAFLKEGCYWRFDWFMNADNPDVTFTQVQCPSDLVARTGCKRSDDASFPVFQPPAATSNPSTPTPTPSSPPPGTPAAPMWGQCGGNGWTGATTCVSGAKCTVINEWYHQCLP